MRILVSHEKYGRVAHAFRKLGHKVYSCDLLPIEPDKDNKSGYLFHLQDSYKEVIKWGKWDMWIAFPDCTYLTVSGLHWNIRDSERAKKTELALKDIRFIMRQNIKKIIIENPIGCISTRIRKPDQIIQPYMFGCDASKATCLWLKGVDPLEIPDKSKWCKPRIVKGLPRWDNQTDSGQNKLAPSDDRASLRGKTYKPIARAFAKNWG